MWIAVGAWSGAAALALLVLGFVAYELSWRAGRLRRDLARLAALQAVADGLQRDLAAARERLTRSVAR